MDSLERWEQRQQNQGRGTRPASRPARTTEPRPRSQAVNVALPHRSFGDWIVAGFGIGIGLFLFGLAVSIPIFLFSVCVGVAAIGNL